MFSATRVLRQAAAHAQRTPSIRFVGRRTIPSNVDQTPQPHPESPTGTLPEGFGGYGSGSNASRHPNFSVYRQHVQQHGPLQKTIRSSDEQAGIGGLTGYELGSVHAPNGSFFDRSELPARFRRQPISAAELEAVDSGGASLYG